MAAATAVIPRGAATQEALLNELPVLLPASALPGLSKPGRILHIDLRDTLTVTPPYMKCLNDLNNTI